LPLSLGLSLLYVILFPWLPGRTFSLRAIWLSLAPALLLLGDLYYGLLGSLDGTSLLFYLLFSSGFLIFFALSFTGNSGVSNYSLVKKEIVRFLPISAICLLSSVCLVIVKGSTG